MHRYPRPMGPTGNAPPPARLGAPGFTILLAIGIAVAARLAVPPEPLRDAEIGTSLYTDAPVFSQEPILPVRAAQRPPPRPGLPSGLALVVVPVTVVPLGATKTP